MIRNIGALALASMSILATFSSVHAATGLSHDAIDPIDAAYLTVQEEYQPYFSKTSGCYPYTAVDMDGNWNKGLKDSGSASGSCSSQNYQQVYVRQKMIDSNTLALMYAYYFPKDNGFIFASLGHRHDWEHVIVFVRNYGTSSEQLVGAAYSAHGGVSATTSPNKSGKHVFIKYGYNGSITHSFVEGSSGNRNQQVLIRWAALSNAARSTLSTEDYGESVVPINNAKFNSEIDEAADALGL